MITDIGKFLDPLADQAYTAFCTYLSYPEIQMDNSCGHTACGEGTYNACRRHKSSQKDRQNAVCALVRQGGDSRTGRFYRTCNSLSRYSGIYCSHDIYSLRSFDNIFARTLSDALQNDDCRACRKKQRGF